MKGKCLLLLLFYGFVSTLNAQTFPTNREKFAKQLLTVISQSATEDEQNFVKKELTNYLINPQNISEEAFNKIVNTANSMDAKRFRFYPDIFQYVQASYYLSKNNSAVENYDNWYTILSNLLDGKSSSKAKDFLTFSSSFLTEGELNRGPNFSWFYMGGNFVFKIDKEPKVLLSGGKLVCQLDNRGKGNNKRLIDSVVVYETSGSFQPLINVFSGKGGRITWEKVGEDPTQLFATFTSKYQINTKLSTLSVDTVSLTTPKFSKTVIGSLSDRAYNINREADKNNPQFTSFEKNLTIKNFSDGVDFTGGFKYEGADFVGSGVGNTLAKLLIYRENKPFIVVRANTIINGAKSIFANDASVVIFISPNDSIVQPSINFNYIKRTQSFEFSRSDIGSNSAPFVSVYHQLDMYVPKIIWQKGTDSLVLTYGQEVAEAARIASFESKNFFSEQQFNDLQGMASINPLILLYNYCYKYDEFNLDESKFAISQNRTIEQSRDLMLMLNNRGFISWNQKTHKILVTDKTKQFIDAHKKIRDYDNLALISDLRIARMPAQYTDEQIRSDSKLKQLQESIQRKNEKTKNVRNFGSINLKTLALNINAIERVNLSEKSFTFIVPDNDRLTVGKNREIDFNGWLRSGKIEIKVLKGRYDYAKNLVDLIKTDNTILSVNSREAKSESVGEPQFVFLNSFISNVQGIVYVDLPNNRAGNDPSITNYPKLEIKNHARVYYNDPSIQRAAYDTARFYYVVDPVVIDSLDNFKDDNIRINGELVSAGIFPKFREPLRVMPDYSLGFIKDSPKGGYPFYETTAKYENKIVLSNNGLQGSGRIDFIKSSSESAQFTFLPDSAIGTAKFINQPVETGVQYPDVLGKKVEISYNPRKQYLNVYSLEDPVLMFNDIQFKGKLTLKNDGLTGNGNLLMPDASLRSRIFKFTRWQSNADTSDFSLKNKYAEAGEGKISLATANVNANLDFKTRIGNFRSNKGTTKTNFPLNNFYCIMDSYKWFMDDENIALEAQKEKSINIDAGLNLKTSNFFSTDPKRDSLDFMVPMATFSIKEKTIFCDKMDYVDIADARIYPKNGKLNIRKKGVIDELTDSKIVANFVTKYFTFNQASIQINTGRDYTATGKYPYVNAYSDTSLINMSKIYVDTAYETRAVGVITETDGFKLSDKFDYYGNVLIKASIPSINFDGSVRINHNCNNFTRSWMAFNAPIDPKNIRIPVGTTMKTREGDIVTTGLVWRDSKVPDSVRIYPAFLSKVQSAQDMILMSASGYLQYDSLAREFQISTAEKLTNREEKGNFISLNIGTCSLRGDGKIDLGMDYGNLQVDNYGVVNYNSDNNETTMNLTMKIVFPAMDQGVMEKWGERIAANESLSPLDINNSTLTQTFAELVSKREADEMKNEYVQKGKIKKLDKVFTDGITFTGIQLKSYYKDLNNGLVTSVGFASLVNVYGKLVFKQIPFNAYFKKVYSGNVTGDRLQIQMDIPGLNQYFWNYQMEKKKGLLQIYTDDATMKNDINAKKEEARKAKNFTYQTTDNSGIMGNFLRIFK